MLLRMEARNNCYRIRDRGWPPGRMDAPRVVVFCGGCDVEAGAWVVARPGIQCREWLGVVLHRRWRSRPRQTVRNTREHASIVTSRELAGPGGQSDHGQRGPLAVPTSRFAANPPSIMEKASRGPCLGFHHGRYGPPLAPSIQRRQLQRFPTRGEQDGYDPMAAGGYIVYADPLLHQGSPAG